jgi:xylulose-5-phosphate/fructose-6-phosphate phosphoketolase
MVSEILEQQEQTEKQLRVLDAYWRAANYLSVGQIYLRDNPLLTEPLKLEHIKTRLLGHWGTTPGLNFIYAHCNRVINKYGLDMIFMAGPGHGGPAVVANTYLEGSYSEFYPNIRQDSDGMRRLFGQFSFPGGIPSHASPETPGSIHEGANSDMPCSTLTVRHSTTRTSSSAAWLVTVRPKPDPSRQAGTPISF